VWLFAVPLTVHAIGFNQRLMTKFLSAEPISAKNWRAWLLLCRKFFGRSGRNQNFSKLFAYSLIATRYLRSPFTIRYSPIASRCRFGSPSHSIVAKFR